MNEQIINQALEEIIRGFISTKDFVLEQAPDVISQLLVFSLLQGSAWVVFFFAVTVILTILFFKLISPIKEAWEKEDAAVIPLAAGLVASFVLAAVNIVSFIQYLLITAKIIVAPKLFLIQYAADLIK